jgi:transcriptional regulator with XRE-family HTH domain
MVAFSYDVEGTRMRDRESTVRSRELGDALRRAMVRAGLSGSEVARRLEWSQSRVSRLLNGKRGGSEHDVLSFMVICGVTGNEHEHLLEICRHANTPGLLQRFTDGLPMQVQTLVDHENAAIRISDFQLTFVSGLAQTARYARSIISSNVSVPPGQVEDWVAVRMARQSILSRPPQIQFTFFLHEFILRLPVGGADVMSEQLHYLLQLSVRPSISIRVVPAAAGAHAGMSGAFTMMDFAEVRPVVYVEGETCGLFMEEAAETLAYRNILAALAETALDEGQSRQLIRDVVTELYSDGEDHDDLAQEQL